MSDSSRERNETYTKDYHAVLCPYCNESNDLSESIQTRGEDVCQWDCGDCGKNIRRASPHFDKRNSRGAAMTPKTQSVCKHCQQPKGDLVHSRWAAPELHHKFEPVAEPASTGEPGTGFYRSASLQESIAQDEAERAARPSEPSAPQIGAYSGIGNEEVKWTMKGLTAQGNAAPQTSAEPSIRRDHDEVPLSRRNFKSVAAAPQPVSGDAPTIADYEEILADHRRLVRELDVLLNGEAGAAKQASLCDIVAQVAGRVKAGDAPKVEEAREYFNFWWIKGNPSADCAKHAAALLAEIDRLRPYFPPASQTPLKAETWEGAAKEYIEGKFLKEVAAKYVSDEDLLIVMGFFGERMYNIGHADALATPASTARTDGWVSGNKYTMIFALSPDFGSVALLLKPETHHNPLFRGRWTVPGGLLEVGESEIDGAVREFKEETQLTVAAKDLRFVMRFLCNCDTTEPEHEVSVYGAALPIEKLNRAQGSSIEPVSVFSEIPGNAVWYMKHMLPIVIDRMKQPIPAAPGSVPQAEPPKEEKQ